MSAAIPGAGASTPIVPTRVIPAPPVAPPTGAPVPPVAPPAPRPPAPAAPQTAPPAPPVVPPGLPPQWGAGWPWGGQPQPHGPIEVRVQVEMLPVVEPELTWRDRLRAMVARWLRPLWTWRGAVALFLAVAPIPGVGESAVTIWHYTVSEAREMSIGTGYAVGLVPLAFAGWALTRVGPTAPRLWLLSVTAVGAFGAMSWYDVVHLFTGVAR